MQTPLADLPTFPLLCLPKFWELVHHFANARQIYRCKKGLLLYVVFGWSWWQEINANYIGIHQSRSRSLNPPIFCSTVHCVLDGSALWIYWFCPFATLTPGWMMMMMMMMMLEGELLKSGVSTTRGLWLCATVSLVTRRAVSTDSTVINSWMLVQDAFSVYQTTRTTRFQTTHMLRSQMSFELIRKDVPKLCNKSCAACDRSLLGDQMVGALAQKKTDLCFDN